MTPPSCGQSHLIVDRGGAVWLVCSALPGHPGLHQAYHRDRLHEWA